MFDLGLIFSIIKITRQNRKQITEINNNILENSDNTTIMLPIAVNKKINAKINKKMAQSIKVIMSSFCYFIDLAARAAII